MSHVEGPTSGLRCVMWAGLPNGVFGTNQPNTIQQRHDASIQSPRQLSLCGAG